MKNRITVQGTFKGIKRNSLTATHEPRTVVLRHEEGKRKQTERRIQCVCDCGEVVITRFVPWLKGAAKTCMKCRYKHHRKDGAPVHKAEPHISSSAALFLVINGGKDDGQ